MQIVALWPPLRLFFFQAEDGIRGLVRSRGLGDVYKRQALLALALVVACDDTPTAPRPSVASVVVSPGARTLLTGDEQLYSARALDATAVSYTHLTLPTSDLV